MKKQLARNFFVILLFWFLIFLLRWPLKFALLFFGFGLLLGFFLLYLDQVIYCWFQAPHEFTSQRIRRLLTQRHFFRGFVLMLKTQEERRRLVFHSILFQVILLIVSFFVLTSSGSLFGKGLVLGLLLLSLVDQGEEFFKKGNMDSWFWQFKQKPAVNLQAFYLVAIILLFVIFALFWL